MSHQDDSTRDPVRLHEERGAAESPFVDKAVAKESGSRSSMVPGPPPFVKGWELVEYGPEAKYESNPAELEAESLFQSASTGTGWISSPDQVRYRLYSDVKS